MRYKYENWHSTIAILILLSVDIGLWTSTLCRDIQHTTWRIPLDAVWIGISLVFFIGNAFVLSSELKKYIARK